ISHGLPAVPRTSMSRSADRPTTGGIAEQITFQGATIGDHEIICTWRPGIGGRNCTNARRTAEIAEAGRDYALPAHHEHRAGSVAHHGGRIRTEEIRALPRPMRAHDDEVGADRRGLVDDLVMNAALTYGDRHVA